ncbi:sensor histidine kinase DcuS [Ruminiclostridium hungatei]|uniref:histidine kinase n=1 Tax=Ruminiclostridium hungatei TaxID=48256 RepID=A0A1V4SF56_RUMHU|nr:ATP-binding protein [Ruminiclostridium hungatei]OPX42146.1 sensor histidine kinase DcuS [Ruminiclostridium hungatei]
MKNLNISKASVTIIVLNTLLIVAVLVAAVYGFTHGRSIKAISNGNINIFLLFSILIVAINSFIVVYDRYSLKRAHNRYSALNNTLSQIEALNNTLRAQRHDFLNQLQVMYSLLEMNEYLEARQYIENVYQDILKVSRYLKTSSPAVNALLQAKMLACEKAQIEVELNVASQLTDLKMQTWELCRVLGNLIDNAIYALKDKSSGRKLVIDIFQDIKHVGFRIGNNGPEIEKGNLERIFLPGFTTKGEQGEGMGLSIVKELIESNGGIVKVESTPSLTIFEVRVPRVML